MTTPDKGAIMKATPVRAGLGDYRAIVFHSSDDVAEVSPRLCYGDAKTWVAARGAAIALDEHENPDDV
jgi:hypothetical protein